MTRSIIFIHGAWMTPRCWEPFVQYFSARGYLCLAPAWPYHDRDIAQLRASPDPRLGRLGLGEITDHYDQIIRAAPEPPIIIGHSFGGLIAQALLDRGLGAAGVALDPAPTRGVNAAFYPTVTRSLLRIITTPGAWAKVVHWTLPEFSYAFVHTLPPAEQKRAFDEYVVPESGRIFFQGALAAFDAQSPTRVNFANGQRAPLLMIAGMEDRIVPAALVRANFRKYDQRSGATTELMEFPGRTHWLIAQPGWDEIAAAIDRWLTQRLPA